MKRFSRIRKNRRVFSSLGKLPKTATFCLVAASIFVAGSAGLHSPNAWADAEAISRLTETCRSEFTSDDFKKIKFGKEEIRLDQLDEISIGEYCKRNRLNELNIFGSKYNALTPAELEKLKKVAVPSATEVELQRTGACEVAYEAMGLAYKHLKEFSKTICDKRVAAEDRVATCLDVGDAQKDCIKKLQDSIADIESLGKSLNAKDGTPKKLEKLFEATSEPLQRILFDYKRDGEHLQGISVQDRAKKTAIVAFNTNLNSAEFGATSLEEYFTLIGKNGIATRQKELQLNGKMEFSFKRVDQAHLANEIIYAKYNLTEFAKKVKGVFQKSWSETNMSNLSQYKERLSQIQASLKDGKGLGDGLRDYGAPVLGAAKPFMDRGKEVGSSLSAAGGLNGVGTVATMGAAAALTSQIASGRSSGSLSGSGLPIPQEAAPVAPLGGTKLVDGNKETSDSDSGPKASADAKESESTEKTANAATATAAPGTSAAVFSSGGSFLQSGFKRKGSNASKEVSSAGNGSADEPLKGFGGELLSGPAPKKVDPTGDVSSLLGKMSELFKFDDTPPMAPGGDPFTDMGASSDLAEGGVDSPLFPDDSEFDSNGNYSSDDGGGGSRQYASKEEEIMGEKSQMPSYLGGKETPLFKRVKTRHKLCMERGLVVLGLGKLPQ